MDTFYKELNLPKYLENDIEALLNTDKTYRLYDCLLDEVQGSINSAWHGNEIDEQTAMLLYKRYLSNESD